MCKAKVLKAELKMKCPVKCGNPDCKDFDTKVTPGDEEGVLGKLGIEISKGIRNVIMGSHVVL